MVPFAMMRHPSLRSQLARCTAALAMWLLTASAGAAGELVDHAFPSPALGRTWRFAVYQPTGYAQATATYPVLFFLPGAATDPREWRALDLAAIADATIAAGRMPPGLIVVPELGTSWGIDSRERMESALRTDLPNEVARHWRIRSAPRDQAIGGISAGAYAALRIALQEPRRFAALVLLSPAIYHPVPPPGSGARTAGVFGRNGFDPDVWRTLNYPALLPGFTASGARLPLFMGAGSTDNLGTQHEAAGLHAIWSRFGSAAEIRIVPGGHDFATWKQLLPEALAFAFHATGP